MMTTVQAGPLPGTTLPIGARLVAGIGCSSAADVAEIVALVEQCLVELGAAPASLIGLVSHSRKANHPGLLAAAQHFDIPLRLLDDAELRADMPTPSPRVLAAIGQPSIAEAAAAAVGPLLLAKRRSSHATCALALCDGRLDLQAQASSPRASIAASTLSTSCAGP
jgi:cobalamin biosynthesis protein CbiG